MKHKPLTDYVITSHADFEMQRRGLTEEMIRKSILFGCLWAWTAILQRS